MDKYLKIKENFKSSSQNDHKLSSNELDRQIWS